MRIIIVIIIVYSLIYYNIIYVLSEVLSTVDGERQHGCLLLSLKGAHTQASRLPGGLN